MYTHSLTPPLYISNICIFIRKTMQALITSMLDVTIILLIIIRKLDNSTKKNPDYDLIEEIFSAFWSCALPSLFFIWLFSSRLLHRNLSWDWSQNVDGLWGWNKVRVFGEQWVEWTGAVEFTAQKVLIFESLTANE